MSIIKAITNWWHTQRRTASLTRRSVAINDDKAAISQMAPELIGMSFVEGGAYILKQIEAFNSSSTGEQRMEFAARLLASNQSWADKGLTMPYWGNLVVLRRFQAELASTDADVRQQ